MSSPLIVHGRPDGRRRVYTACFGDKKHYRKRGDCKHVQLFHDCLKSDWWRARHWFLPFGDNDRQSVKASEVLL